MPFYPMSAYLPGGDSEHIQPWRDLVLGHGPTCNSGLCQDMRSAMDSMSNMWGAPLHLQPMGDVQLFQGTHAHNPSAAVDCNYSRCQMVQSAMRSMCNMWGLESRFPILTHRDLLANSMHSHGPACDGMVCTVKRQAIIAFVNRQRVTTAVAFAAGNYVGRGLFTYPTVHSDTAREEGTNTVCASGDTCRYFRYHARHMVEEDICTQCGKCSSCSTQCEYSESGPRNDEDLACCSCLDSEHHHCSDCEDWLGQSDGDRCDNCLDRARQGEDEYDFNNTDVSHLIYNCDSCGRQVGSCTCVLAYL